MTMAEMNFKENEFMAALGKSISVLRKKNGYTQEELAKKLGISAQAVSKWENDLSCPDIMLLPELAKALGVSIDELLSGNTEKEEALPAVKEEKTQAQGDTECQPKQKSKVLKHIRIMVTKPDGKVTDVCVPMLVVSFGLNLGRIFGGIGEGNVQKVLDSIDNGLSGEVLNVNTENGDNVRIILE